MQDYTLAFNKLEQIGEKFTQITASLQESLGLKFGYSIAYKSGSYFTLKTSLECTKQIVHSINKGIMLCSENITDREDYYSFLLWPEKSENPALQILHHYGYKNGISLVRDKQDGLEVFYFVGIDENKDWKNFFFRNKRLLKEYINYFEGFKKELQIDSRNINKHLFKFSDGIDLKYPEPILSEEDKILPSLETN